MNDKVRSFFHRQPDGQWVNTYVIDASTSIWHSAVQSADEGDSVPLRLLLLTEPATNEGKALLDDFAERHHLPNGVHGPWTMAQQRSLAEALLNGQTRKRRGRPATPIYARSDLDARIDCAISEVRAVRRAGFNVDESGIAQIANAHRLHTETLLKALDGALGSINRKRKRRRRFLIKRD